MEMRTWVTSNSCRNIRKMVDALHKGVRCGDGKEKHQGAPRPGRTSKPALSVL